MPQMIVLTTGCAAEPVAAEDELLAFCNRVRDAGGAEILESLLPSTPNAPRSCLIANALNFGCRVEPVVYADDPGETVWAMWLPDNITDEQKEKIADAVGEKVEAYNEDQHFVRLPREIANAARAFDYGKAFRDYVVEDDA